jgi:hypothetical protein
MHRLLRSGAFLALLILPPSRLAAANLGSGSAPSTLQDDEPPSPAELQRLLNSSSSSSSTGSSGAVPGTALSIGTSKPVVLPFQIEGGHILIEASLDGHPPRPFFFDTGGRNMITPDLASELDGDGAEKMTIDGVGPNSESVAIMTARSLTIGTVVLDNQKFFVGEISNGLVDRGSRRRAAGLIGSNLLKRYAMRIDYRHRSLTLFPAGQFQPPSDGFSLPMTMQMSPDGLALASVPAEVDGVVGQFAIDTGDPGNIDLFAHFEREHHLFDGYSPTLDFMSPGGIGGRVEILVARGKRIGLGPVVVPTPLLSRPANLRKRAFHRSVAEEFLGGMLGNSVLARFVVSIDYQSGRAYFEPSGKFPGPSPMEGTGVIVDKPRHDAFEVIDILPDTAAARAGIQRGDLIVEAAGHPARDLSLGDFYRLNQDLSRKTLDIQISDSRRFVLAIEQELP